VPDGITTGVPDAARQFFALPEEQRLEIENVQAPQFPGYTRVLAAALGQDEGRFDAWFDEGALTCSWWRRACQRRSSRRARRRDRRRREDVLATVRAVRAGDRERTPGSTAAYTWPGSTRRNQLPQAATTTTMRRSTT
jgi:isopenicillin N synthase-like dioxygenase